MVTFPVAATPAASALLSPPRLVFLARVQHVVRDNLRCHPEQRCPADERQGQPGTGDVVDRDRDEAQTRNPFAGGESGLPAQLRILRGSIFITPSSFA